MKHRFSGNRDEHLPVSFWLHSSSRNLKIHLSSIQWTYPENTTNALSSGQVPLSTHYISPLSSSTSPTLQTMSLKPGTYQIVNVKSNTVVDLWKTDANTSWALDLSLPACRSSIVLPCDSHWMKYQYTINNMLVIIRVQNPAARLYRIDFVLGSAASESLDRATSSTIPTLSFAFCWLGGIIQNRGARDHDRFQSRTTFRFWWNSQISNFSEHQAGVSRLSKVGLAYIIHRWDKLEKTTSTTHHKLLFCNHNCFCRRTGKGENTQAFMISIQCFF